MRVGVKSDCQPTWEWYCPRKESFPWKNHQPLLWFLSRRSNIIKISIRVDSVWIKHLKLGLPPGNILNRGWKCLQLKASGRFSWKKYLVIACIACESWAYRMVHVKSPLLNFKLDLEHENVNILKNGFYHRILQLSEYPKRERAKKNFFFETLLDGPFIT